MFSVIGARPVALKETHDQTVSVCPMHLRVGVKVQISVGAVVKNVRMKVI